MITPSRAGLVAACDLAEELFDGDPERAVEILTGHVAWGGVAADFTVGVVLLAVNALECLGQGRQSLVRNMRAVADSLPVHSAVSAGGDTE